LERLAVCAHVHLERGETEPAAALAAEILTLCRSGGVLGWNSILHMLAWTLCALGRGDELVQILLASDDPWTRAARAFASGDLERSADICGAMGAVSEEARDRLWLAEALVKQNRRADAEQHLQRALDFY